MSIHSKLQLLCWSAIFAHLITGATWIIIIGWLSIAGLDFSHSRRVLKGSMGKKSTRTKSVILVISALVDLLIAFAFSQTWEMGDFYLAKFAVLATLAIVCLIDDDIDKNIKKLRSQAAHIFWRGRYRQSFNYENL